jgi:nitrogen-specific signal transduction histidine kinase
MIRFSPDGESKEEYAGVVVRQIDRINQTISSMLNFAKGQRTKSEIHSLHEIVKDALELTRPQIMTEDVIITTDVSKSLPPVLVDRPQICQVIVNLIINTTQAVSKHGRIEIHATVEGQQ